MSKQDLLKELFGKFLDEKKMTPEEIRQLRDLIHDERNNELLDQLLTAVYEDDTREYQAVDSNARTAYDEVLTRLQGGAPARSPVPASIKLNHGGRWWKYAAAAIVILSFAAGSYRLFRRDTPAALVQQGP